jgi:hypothetical protein
MIDRYYAAYPRVRAYLDETVAEAHRTGVAATMFGRKRRIPELKSSNYNLRSFGERTAMNHPMQGSAADIMKLAMIEVDRRLRAEGSLAHGAAGPRRARVRGPCRGGRALSGMAREAMSGRREAHGAARGGRRERPELGEREVGLEALWRDAAPSGARYTGSAAMGEARGATVMLAPDM